MCFVFYLRIGPGGGGSQWVEAKHANALFTSGSSRTKAFPYSSFHIVATHNDQPMQSIFLSSIYVLFTLFGYWVC